MSPKCAATSTRGRPTAHIDSYNGSEFLYCSVAHPSIYVEETDETITSGCCTATETECTCQKASDEGCTCAPDDGPCKAT